MIFVGITAAFILLLLAARKQSYRPLSVLYTMAIAFLAFCAEPKYDLFNYCFGTMELYREMPFVSFLERMGEEGEPVVQFYFYLLSKLPDKAFLMLFTVLIVYGLLFSLLFKLEKRYELSRNSLLVLTIWLIGTTPYYTVFAGVRYQMAFTIFGYALYTELVEERRKPLCWLAYLAAALIHNSAIVLLLLRLLLLIYSRYTGVLAAGAVFFGCLLVMPIVSQLSAYTDNTFLLGILDKAEGYYSEGDSDLSVGNWIVAALMVLGGAVTVFFYRRYRGREAGMDRIRGYLLLLLAFCIGSEYSSDVFSRFGAAVKLASLPLLAFILHSVQTDLEEELRWPPV